MDIFAAWSWWCNLVKHFSRWYLRSLLSRIRSASKTLISTMLWLKHSGYSTNYLVNFLHVYRYLTLCNCCISCFYQAGIGYVHDDVIKLKHFPRYWPFVRGIHRWPVNSPHKGQCLRSFDVLFDLRLNERLSKQSWDWWLETSSRSLWRHCNDLTLCNCCISCAYLACITAALLRWHLANNPMIQRIFCINLQNQ